MFLTILTLLVLAGAPAGGEDSVDLGGPHAVGFRVHRWEDPTRAFPTWPGATTRSSRPLRIFEWYPASAGGELEARRVRWQDYLVFENDAGYIDQTQISDDTRRQILEAYRDRVVERHQLSADDADSLIETRLRAVEGLQVLRGRHPLVILRGMPRSLGLLAEELASRGYVVFAPGYLSEASRYDLHHFPDPAGLERAVRDLQFTFSRAAELSHVDPTRLGLVGFSSATLPTLLWQMSDLRARALVAIEGWEGFLRGVEVLEESPRYRPRAVRVPHLLVEKAAEERDESYAKSDRVLGAMRSARRERVTFTDATHFSFLGEAKLLAALPRAVDDARADEDRNALAIHQAALDHIVEFLDRHMRDRPAATIDSLAERTQSHREGEPPLPTEEEIARLIELRRFDELRTIIEATEARSNEAPVEPLFDRRTLRRVVEAIPDRTGRRDGFDLIAAANPRSTWAWIDLAEACGDLGDAEGARRAYRKAIEMIDDDPTIPDDRRDRLRQGIAEELDD